VADGFDCGLVVITGSVPLFLEGTEDGHVGDLELVSQVSHGGDLPRPEPVDEPLFLFGKHSITPLLYAITTGDYSPIQ
jgi:hypothetical protein